MEVLKNAITSSLIAINNGISNLASGIYNLFSPALELLKTGINNIFNTVDTINTSIVTFFANIVNDTIEAFTDLFEFLFIPEEDFFTTIKTDLQTHFGFIFQIIAMQETIINITNYASSETPNFTITYKGNTMQIIDFSFYNQYRSFIHSIILFIAWFDFVIWLLRNAPAILGGFGTLERQQLREMRRNE